jgi:hypothetical protein
VRKDGTPKPSYDALRALVKGEWWLSPTTVATDSEGRISVAGFAGDYELRARGESSPFALRRGDGPLRVALPPRR